MQVPSKVTIVEVGPRDGLQNERASIEHRRQDRVRRSAVGRRPPGDRGVGVRVAEVGAADGRRGGGVRRHHAPAGHADTPRSCRIGRASNAPSPPACPEVAIFAAASETFSRRNINQSIDESLATYAAVCADAAAAGLRVRGYLSTCFVCPFEGRDRAAPRGRHRRAAARHRRLRSGDQRHDRRGALPVTCSVSSEP